MGRKIRVRGTVVLLLAMVAVTAGCRYLPRDHEAPDPTYAFQPASEGPLEVFSSTCVDRVENGESCFLLLDRSDEENIGPVDV